MTDFSDAALIIIDVQKAIDAPYHAAEGPRNNLGPEANIARLLSVWRRQGRRVIHVRHNSTFPTSAYAQGQSGNDFKDEASPLAGETVVAKTVNSAFIGTDLERLLRQAGVSRLVIAGVVTNNSVEATVRMAGNLGFEVHLVEDACFTFARCDFDGRLRSAEEVNAMSLANLDGEYARVVRVGDVVA